MFIISAVQCQVQYWFHKVGKGEQNLTCPWPVQRDKTEGFYFICFYSDSVCSNWVKVHLETNRTKGLLLVLDIFPLQISPKGFFKKSPPAECRKPQAYGNVAALWKGKHCLRLSSAGLAFFFFFSPPPFFFFLPSFHLLTAKSISQVDSEPGENTGGERS